MIDDYSFDHKEHLQWLGKFGNIIYTEIFLEVSFKNYWVAIWLTPK